MLRDIDTIMNDYDMLNRFDKYYMHAELKFSFAILILLAIKAVSKIAQSITLCHNFKLPSAPYSEEVTREKICSRFAHNFVLRAN